MQLSDTWVIRGGVTAAYWTRETKKVSAKVKDGLHVMFSIASKGGGTTGVRLEIGLTDIRKLVVSLASSHPELADAFAEATHISVAKMVAEKQS